MAVRHGRGPRRVGRAPRSTAAAILVVVVALVPLVTRSFPVRAMAPRRRSRPQPRPWEPSRVCDNKGRQARLAQWAFIATSASEPRLPRRDVVPPFRTDGFQGPLRIRGTSHHHSRATQPQRGGSPSRRLVSSYSAIGTSLASSTDEASPRNIADALSNDGLHPIDQDEDEPTPPSRLRSVTFCVPKFDEPDLLCEFLMEVGAAATSLTDARAGTRQETALFGEPVVGTVDGGAYHRHDVWDLCNVTALFPDSVNLKDVVDLVQMSFLSRDDEAEDDMRANGRKGRLEVQVQTVDDRDWVVHVQQSWKPIVVGRFVLKFPWHDMSAVQQALRQVGRDDREHDKVDPIVLELQGGVAFGTGEHATTQLCLEWVADEVSERLVSHHDKALPLEVLDYGSGSGILGMAACALDRDRVASVGIDIDVDACRIANDNARRNGVNMRNYLPPSALLRTDPDDAESQSLLLKAHRQAQLFRRRHDDTDSGDGLAIDSREASVILPDELDQRTFPIVVANILAAPLTMLAPSLMRRVAPGGRLGLSGVLRHQAEAVLEAYEREGLVGGRVERQLGDWVLITGTKPTDCE